jgi:tetratricopeptide (TPR) repeat protein
MMVLPMRGSKISSATRLACLTLFILISMQTVHAQISHMTVGGTRITGHVRDASGKPLTAVRVEVSPMGGISMLYVQTGTDGEFQIGGIQDGEYDISVNADGYKPFRESVSLANGNLISLPISLERLPPEAEVPAAALSAHELTVPQKARDFYLKGIALKAKPDYAAALEEFQKAVKQFPTYYEAYAEAGVAEVNLKQFDAARKDLQKAIDLSDGKYATAIFYMAGLLNNQRQYDEALSTAKKGLAIEDNAWRGQFEMARALTGLKRGDEAVPFAKKAVELAPENPQMYIVLMNANLGAGDYPAALSAIDEFLKLSGTGPQADQVRRLREQVQAEIQKNQAKAAAAGSPPAQQNPPASTTPPAASNPAPH